MSRGPFTVTVEEVSRELIKIDQTFNSALNKMYENTDNGGCFDHEDKIDHDCAVCALVVLSNARYSVMSTSLATIIAQMKKNKSSKIHLV